VLINESFPIGRLYCHANGCHEFPVVLYCSEIKVLWSSLLSQRNSVHKCLTFPTIIAYPPSATVFREVFKESRGLNIQFRFHRQTIKISRTAGTNFKNCRVKWRDWLPTAIGSNHYRVSSMYLHSSPVGSNLKLTLSMPLMSLITYRGNLLSWFLSKSMKVEKTTHLQF